MAQATIRTIKKGLNTYLLRGKGEKAGEENTQLKLDSQGVEQHFRQEKYL